MHASRRSARFLPAGLALVLLLAAGPGWAVFPEYTSQDSVHTFWHSGIVTSDNKVVWDFAFAKLVKGVAGHGYNEIAFAFNQCFGGGMIDELADGLQLLPASYTSASRHDQLSFYACVDIQAGADPLLPDNAACESSYNLHYAPVAGGAPGGRVPQTQQTAANVAYNNDLVGQVVNGARLFTNPQWTSSGAVGRGITLHNANPNAGPPPPNPQYRAILFAGSTQLDGNVARLNLLTRGIAGAFQVPANWESLSRMYNAMLAAGYQPNEVWAAYPGGRGGRIFPAVPGNMINVPAWVDSDTRAADLKTAFNWLAGQTNASTQIFYWNSVGHGDRAFDFIGWLLSLGKSLLNAVPFSFSLDPGFTNQIVTFYNTLNPNNGQGAPGSPDLKITTTVPASFTVLLDGQQLMATDGGDIWGDGTEFQFSFALSRSNITALAGGSSHTLTVSVASGPPNALSAIELLGFTTGDQPPDGAQ